MRWNPRGEKSHESAFLRYVAGNKKKTHGPVHSSIFKKPQQTNKTHKAMHVIAESAAAATAAPVSKQ